MRNLMLLFALASLAGCAGKAAYVADCQKASFSPTQCQFLYSKRDIRLGVSGPLIGGLIGINLP